MQMQTYTDATEKWKKNIIYLQRIFFIRFPSGDSIRSVLATIQQPIKVWLANFAAVSWFSHFFFTSSKSTHRILCCASSHRISGIQSKYQARIGKCLWTVASANAHNNNSHGWGNLVTTHRSQFFVVVTTLLFMWYGKCLHWRSLTHRQTNEPKNNNVDSSQIPGVERRRKQSEKKEFQISLLSFFALSATMETWHFYMFFFFRWDWIVN